MSAVNLSMRIDDPGIGDGLQAIAFCAGLTIEEVVLDVLNVIADRSFCLDELLDDSLDLADRQTPQIPASAVVERFRIYRDINGLDFPDSAIAKRLEE